MILSEEEAKKKVCHLSRNRSPLDSSHKCTASRCMAWRWYGWRHDHGLRKTTYEFPEDKTEVRVGYCGLAGVPQ